MLFPSTFLLLFISLILGAEAWWWSSDDTTTTTVRQVFRPNILSFKDNDKTSLSEQRGTTGMFVS